MLITSIYIFYIDRGVSVYTVLNGILEDMASKKRIPSVSRLTKDFHVWPDFHGNRAPLADSSLKGMVR